VESSERIAALRKRLFERKGSGETRSLCAVMARSLRASEDIASWQVRRGLVTRDRLGALQFEIDDLELLAGRLRRGGSSGVDAEEAEAREYLKQYPGAGGQTGHCELDVDDVLAHGIEGVRRDLHKRLEEATGDAAEAYESFLHALGGLSMMIMHAAEAVEDAMADASPERRDELKVIADSCRRIASEPPVSFRDALQLLWFVDFAVMAGDEVGLVVPGHMDRTLYPFYKAGRATDTLDPDDALVLIEQFYLLINEFIPDGLAMSVMVGGRDANGNDVTNELSYLCLEALRRTRFIYPSVGVCWHERTPPDLVELAVDLMGHGIPTPAFFGDDTIQRGLKALGVPPDQACHYINSTCVEITPARGSNVWVASPYFSTCRILLDEVAEQVAGNDVADGFDTFLKRYFERLAGHIDRAVEAENETRQRRQQYSRKPLQSVFTRDCIGRGRDIDDGGALYNWVECSFVGLANLVDSLHVLREEVFNGGGLSLAELKDVLDADFVGHEPVRQRLLEGLPKYGQDRPEVDALFDEVVGFVRGECARHKMLPDDSPFVPGAFCWVMHEHLGRECTATPDGRKAGVPFADGCGPAQGRESCGPTAAILSTTSWDHAPMIGGLAYNMKFNSGLFDSSEGFDGLRNLILTFLKRGGFETQVNVTDGDTLRKARANPEAYKDLVVRIGGYCDYFTRLSPEMQDEVILRTEFTHV
jgi:trans-4-hydroxy-L-proline dehydratase